VRTILHLRRVCLELAKDRSMADRHSQASHDPF
jgi:hypothetical protein